MMMKSAPAMNAFSIYAEADYLYLQILFRAKFLRGVHSTLMGGRNFRDFIIDVTQVNYVVPPYNNKFPSQ